jgi:signal recognition particle subunit SRP54
MTPGERRNESILNGSRRKRIARGSGTTVEEVNRLLKQFMEMKRVLQMMGQGGLPGMKAAMQGAGRRQLPQGGMPPDSFGGMKKRKKGGPWGLIKAR